MALVRNALIAKLKQLVQDLPADQEQLENWLRKAETLYAELQAHNKVAVAQKDSALSVLPTHPSSRQRL